MNHTENVVELLARVLTVQGGYQALFISGRARSARPAGPKITLRFSRL